MATETFVKPVMANGHDGYDDDDDDEMPLVFKRSNTVASNSSQSNPNSRKGKTVSPPKALPMRSPQVSPNGITSSVRNSTMKSPPPSSSSSKASPVKSPMQNYKSPTVNDGNKPRKDPSGFKSDNDDSEDDTPLSAILSGNSSRSNKAPTSSQQITPQKSKQKISGNPAMDRSNKNIKDESDDEVPISARIQKKAGNETSGSKPEYEDEKKPLARKFQSNGSVIKNEGQNSKLSGKRPLDKSNSADQSSIKKAKVSTSSISVAVKQEYVKAEKSDDKRKVLVSPGPMKGKQKSIKEDGSDDDNVPIAKKMKLNSSNMKTSSAKPKVAKQNTPSSSLKQNTPSSAAKARVTKVVSSSPKKMTKNKKGKIDSEYSKSSKSLPSGDGQKKWTTLVHNGVIFPPPYSPHGIKILYKGKPVELTPEQEEVATMFAVMTETDYYNKTQFRENFWNDWQKLLGENHVIQKLDDCDFTPVYEWHLKEKEKKKQMSTEEKKALKEEKLKQEEKYMWAIVDGVKEKVGNFRVEPPGLFRGRGEHPKMGKLKKRICPCDITLNIGKGAPIPECPIPGESWKEVKHDNTVTWLAFWNDPINPKEFKYVFLAASSSLKGQSDKEKYEKARKLKDHIDSIRDTYTKNFTAKDIMKKQIAVATYLIDKLALRAGNEKDDDEADTVGCCTLKVGNVECIPPNKLKFDFLGKDSIQYVNTVEVEPPVYKAIGQFQTGKSKADDLFDQLDTSKLNAHLKELMPGLTAKVFRTYNASITLDVMLSEETRDGDVAEKVVVYQQANKQVAIICNHQRSVSKSHGAQIEKLAGKIEELRDLIKELRTDLGRAKKGKPPLAGSDGKKKRNLAPEALERKIAQTNGKIEKMERDMQTKEDMKTVALGTSKINYMDPRISVAWCKRHDVPIEKIFNKSLLAKFAWAMDVEPDFRF
ncbi:PREDICTED: DNA topoisomerase 1 alpha [Tarenaya hassleriana]|uniref:DNA topoisomerase 1 alpha n=1 Tax=Tarenaya hassleriana TaxID=28532 RepID=UPI00053C856E|nr:PREDICTED: DNA topoisomerase 1 alpha [Tarenaya hassleriana]XP_010536699.1 PREDICTED: DNA topoisomerase 1 alpha [Tarenaya hassleriana]